MGFDYRSFFEYEALIHPSFSRGFRHVGKFQDRKKVTRLIHHIHSTHEHQAHGLCMLRLTQIYTNWYTNNNNNNNNFTFFLSISTHSLQTEQGNPPVLFSSLHLPYTTTRTFTSCYHQSAPANHEEDPADSDHTGRSHHSASHTTPRPDV